MKENSKNPREIDILTKDIGSWSKKTFVFMKKAEVKTWHGVLIITFVCGIFTALIWAISFKQSPFLLAAPKYTGTANLSWDANSESDLAGYNIYYGTSHRTGDDPNACSLCGYENKISVGSDTTDYSFDDLINSKTYYFSVTAFDNSGNESSFSSEVNKTTEADVDPPILSAGAPSGTLDSGTVQTNLTLSTDEDANCKYSTTTGIAYASMANTFSATGETDHSVAVTGLSNGNTYHYYVRCQDEALAPNANSNDYEITFSISSAADITAPVRSDGSPKNELSSKITSATLSLVTNENSTCKYGTTSNADYNSMANTFSTTGGTNHSSEIAGLSEGKSYNYYVRCQDEKNNLNNDDYVISFSIDKKSSSKDKEKPAPKRSISNRPKVVSRGQMLVQSGKRFSKSSNVAVYFSRPQGGYYNPQIVKTNRAGKFNIVYKVNKPAGKYGWYAVDLKTGRKSKTIVYRVK